MKLTNPIVYIAIVAFVASCKPETFTVDNSLFNHEHRETLGLGICPGMTTSEVFHPQADDNHYNHAAAVCVYKDNIYVMWQSSKVDEDAPDTHVRYSYSADGRKWSAPFNITEPDSSSVITTSGGWHVTADSLIAYINVWINDTVTGDKDGHVLYRASADGIRWSSPKAVLTADGDTLRGIIEQDVRPLNESRLLTAVHLMPGLILKPCYTDDMSGVGGWRTGEMTNMENNSQKSSRELEPSWFVRDDNAVVMVMRDQQSSFKKIASVSHDNGETWSTPTIVDTPDSRSKQSAGNLPDGKGAYMVYNPSGNKERVPLALVMSDDGFHFDRAYLIRSALPDDLPTMRQTGKFKRVGYSYPKSFTHKDKIYIVYATNKEDIDISEIVFPMCVPFEKH